MFQTSFPVGKIDDVTMTHMIHGALNMLHIKNLSIDSGLTGSSGKTVLRVLFSFFDIASPEVSRGL